MTNQQKHLEYAKAQRALRDAVERFSQIDPVKEPEKVQHAVNDAEAALWKVRAVVLP